METARRTVIAGTLALLLASAARADGRRDFTSYGPGTAGAGYGDAATSYANDLSAAYYNPALLASLSRGSFAASHFILFDGTSYNYLALGCPASCGYLAFSLTQLLSGPIESRRSVEAKASVVHTAQYTAAASLGAPLGVFGLAAGANLRYFYMDLAGYTAGSFGADAGLSRGLPGPSVLGNPSSVSLGLSVRNIFPPVMKFIQDADQYPSVLVLGASLRVPLSRPSDPARYDKLTVATDAEYNPDLGELSLRPGVEYGYLNRYFIRAGYRDNVTFGLGMRTENLQVDYALDPKPYTLMHRLGFSYYWGEAKAADESGDDAGSRETYHAAQRLYREQLGQCKKLVDEGEYAPAIEMLQRAAFLAPGDGRADALRAKAEERMSAAQREAFRREIDEKIASGANAGAYRSALERFYAARTGQETARDDAWQQAKMLSEGAPASLRRLLGAIRKEYAAKLDLDTENAAVNDDFPGAERSLAKLRLLDPGGTAAPDKARLIDERRESRIDEIITQINDAIEHSRDEEAYLLVLQMLELEPGNTEALAAKQRLKNTILSARPLGSRELLYCDELYYAAAYSFACGDTPAADKYLTDLFSLDPVHEPGVKLRRFMQEGGYDDSSPR